MKSLHDFVSVHLHKSPVDGRKQINGLAAIVESVSAQNLFDGGLFVFTSRRRDVIKLLYWDKSGFSLWMKRLEKERFRWPLKMDGDVITLSCEQLSWLLDGYDITHMKPHATLIYSSIS